MSNYRWARGIGSVGRMLATVGLTAALVPGTLGPPAPARAQEIESAARLELFI
jgi:hypothetical protein